MANLAEKIFKRKIVPRYPENARDKESIYITNPFSSTHTGVDYGTSNNKWNQWSLEDGSVTKSQYDDISGNHIQIEYPRIGIEVYCGHLDNRSLKVGDKVNGDTIIGKTGMTGVATGIHLHLMYRTVNGNVKGPWSDPEKYDYKPIEESSYTKGIYNLLANMNVRSGAGTNYSIVKVSQTTKALRNALISKVLNANAVIKQGTNITALEIVTNKDGSVWLKNYSGFVCIKGASGTIYCKKV